MNGVKRQDHKKEGREATIFYTEGPGMIDREIKEQIRASLIKSSTGEERLEKAGLVHMQRQSNRQEV